MVPIQPFTTGINPVDFQIDPQEDYIDLSRSYFQIDWTLKKTGGGNAVTAENTCLINNIAHSLFKQNSVRLNGTLISPQTDTYHYKAYLETLLNFDRDDGETILKPQGWFNTVNVPDALTANQLDLAHDDFEALTPDNQALVRDLRANNSTTAGGVTRTLCFVPHIEVFHTNKLLIPNVQLGIQLYFNSADLWRRAFEGTNAFRLLGEDIKLKLYLCQVRLNPEIYINLMKIHKYLYFYNIYITHFMYVYFCVHILASVLFFAYASVYTSFVYNFHAFVYVHFSVHILA